MNYEIFGSTMPVVICTLNTGEKLYSRAGAMKWMSSDIQMETGMDGGLMGAFKRTLSGESAFLNHFSAGRDGETIAFGNSFPGHILHFDISQRPVICQRRAFLAAGEEVELDIEVKRSLGTGFFGGEGFVMQRLSGRGEAFVEIDGECFEMALQAGQRMKVETGSVGAYEETVSMNIERVRGVSNVLFGGEGMFLTTLEGPGKVWIQTMPIQSMAAEVSEFLPGVDS